MDPTARGNDALNQGVSAASNHAAPTPNKAVPALNKAADPALNKTAVPAVNKAAVPAVNKAAVPAVNKAAVPALNKAAVPAVNKAAVPALNKAAFPAVNKAAVPALNKTAVPAVNKTAVPVPNKLAALDLSKAAAPDLSKVASTDPRKAASKDPSKAASKDPSKGASTDPSKTASTDPSKAAFKDPSKAASTDPGKAASTDPGKAASTDPNKTASTDPSKAASTDPGKAASTDPNKVASKDPNKAASTDPSKAASTDPNKAASTDPSKAASTDPNKAASTDPSKAASKDPNKAAFTDPSKAASTDPNKATSLDQNKTAFPDSSKAVEAAVAGEPCKSVGGDPTKGEKWFETSWLKIKPNVYVLVRFAYFLACNAALAIHGLCVFVRGLVRFTDTRRKFSNPQVTTTETTNGIISIIVGSVAIVVGSFGLFCTLMKNRVLSIANLVVLCLSILGFVIFIFLYLKDTADFVAEEKASTREGMLTLYDISVVKSSKQFTAAINLIQQKNKCCGWSGQVEKNIYLKTPWFRKVNANSSSQSQSLPESCCSGTKLDCLSFKDMKAAREKRLIHPRDCWDMVAEEFNTKVNGVLIELIVGSVIQALCIIPPLLSFAWIGIELLRSRFALLRTSSPKK